MASGEELLAAQESVTSVQVSDPVRRYIVSLTEATRTPADVSLGVSPRGMLWMLRAAQAWAAIHGRDYVLPDDVKKLARAVREKAMHPEPAEGLRIAWSPGGDAAGVLGAARLAMLEA